MDAGQSGVSKGKLGGLEKGCESKGRAGERGHEEGKLSNTRRDVCVCVYTLSVVTRTACYALKGHCP